MSRFLHGFISERSSELYTTSGSFDDYLSAKMGIAGFTVELPDKGGKGFVLPPERIRGVGAEALEAAVFFTEFVTEREIPRNGE